MKKVLVFLIVLATTFAVFANAEEETAVTAAAEEVNKYLPSGEAPAEKIHLVCWSNFSGDAGNVLENAAKAFNESQSQYDVEVIYTSSITTKVKSSTLEDRPNMFVTSGNESASIISMEEDKRLFVPIQNYIDFDNYDMSNVYPNLKTTYSRNGNWMSMPIASTSVGVYYNTTILKAHGIDCDEINSLEDIYEVGLKLKAEGVETPIFFNTASVDWLNYFLCAEGIVYFNNDNGRDGVPTASYFGVDGACHDATLYHFQLVKKMADAGLLASTELVPADRYGMFAKQDFPIAFNSSSNYMAHYNLIGDTFEFVYRPIMTIYDSSKNHGQAAGGYTLFIADVNDAWAEYGSWQFMKYLMTDEWTSEFAVKTGYFPITETGTATEKYQNYTQTINPSANSTLKAMLETEEGIGYGLIPFSNDYGTTWKTILKKMINTPEYSAEAAFEDFVKGVNDCLEMYWMSQGVVL